MLTRPRSSSAASSAAFLILMLLTFSACGGDGESEEEREAERTKVECSGDAVTPELPADFPAVDGITITESTEAGPSHVADGYFEGTLEEAYESYKTAIRDAGYKVIFDEIEEDDSEVAYSGGDSNTSGIVALRKNCEQDGRISVHITNRPE